MQPILHLSLPVRDLGTSRDFYVEVLGCGLARERPRFIDVWFYGLQLTLHERPDEVLTPEAIDVRHFGVTLGRDDLAELLTRLEATDVEWASTVSTDFAGTPQEQTKAKIVDPSGNVIELKAYADPAAVFTLP